MVCITSNHLQAEDEIAYNLLKHLMYVMGCRRQYRPDFIGLQVSLIYNNCSGLRSWNEHEHYEV